MIIKGKMTLNSINECPLKGKGLLKKVVQSCPELAEGKAAGDLAPAAYIST